jgi:hypothetical protein
MGRGIALALAEAGGDIVINYTSAAGPAEEVAHDAGRHDVRAVTCQADVSKQDQVQQLSRSTVEKLGTVDNLVANAELQADAALEEMTLDQWNKEIDVHLTGQFFSCREAVREFMRHGVVPAVSRSAGKIVCISSVHEVIPWSGHGPPIPCGCSFEAWSVGELLRLEEVVLCSIGNDQRWSSSTSPYSDQPTRHVKVDPGISGSVIQSFIRTVRKTLGGRIRNHRIDPKDSVLMLHATEDSCHLGQLAMEAIRRLLPEGEVPGVRLRTAAVR